jgi:hypothetical protein
MLSGGFAFRAGRLLFRWRAGIGFAGFALALLTGQGSVFSCLAGLPLPQNGKRLTAYPILGFGFWVSD